MKLNPFSKKPTAYFSKAKAEYDRLDRQFNDAQAELKEAESDAERKKARHEELRERGSIYSSTKEEGKASIAASAAGHRVSEIKSRISQLESQIAPVMRIALAPEHYAEAQQVLEGLVTKSTAIGREYGQADALLGKLAKRIDELTGRIAAETQAASESMLSGEGDFVVPEGLARLETELKLVHTARADLLGKQETRATESQKMSRDIREAQHTYISCRARMAELEVYEQLMPVMHLIARASAARGEISSGQYDKRRFEIEIPLELIESAQASLNAELPSD